MVLEFNQLKEEIVNVLEREKSIILATSANNKVTARTISHVNSGLIIYFQTNSNSEKAQQIEQNPNVAFAVGNIQIEAIALKCGHPMESKNKGFVVKYKDKFPAYFEKYTNLPDETLFEASPLKIKIYKYVDSNPTIIVLNMQENKAYFE